MGDWYVWNGVENVSPPTRSAFGINFSRRWRDFTDGMSHTLLMSEVKNYQVTVRDCGAFSQISDPAPAAIPSLPLCSDGWAVLAEKDDYDDVQMTNLPVDYINVVQLHQLLLDSGWQDSHVRQGVNL